MKCVTDTLKSSPKNQIRRPRATMLTKTSPAATTATAPATESQQKLVFNRSTAFFPSPSWFSLLFWHLAIVAIAGAALARKAYCRPCYIGKSPISLTRALRKDTQNRSQILVQLSGSGPQGKGAVVPVFARRRVAGRATAIRVARSPRQYIQGLAPLSHRWQCISNIAA